MVSLVGPGRPALRDSGRGFDAVPGPVRSPVRFSQTAARPGVNVGDPRLGRGGLAFDDLAQVEPQSAPQQFTLVKRRAARAFRQQ